MIRRVQLASSPRPEEPRSGRLEGRSQPNRRKFLCSAAAARPVVYCLARRPSLDGASIYILECADGSYYTGITRRSLEERVSEHAQGLIPDCYTFMRRPVKLIFAEHYERITDAIAAERRIKGWSRAKKEAYMRGDFAALTVLAKRGPKGSD